MAVFIRARQPRLRFVDHELHVIQTDDFHLSSIRAVSKDRYDVLIVYTRAWVPRNGVMNLSPVKRFLTRFYEWEPAITPVDCEELGLISTASWQSRGQEITVYVRPDSRARNLPVHVGSF